MGEGLADNQPASCSNMATQKIYKEFNSKTIFKLNSFMSKTVKAVLYKYYLKIKCNNIYALFQDRK